MFKSIIRKSMSVIQKNIFIHTIRTNYINFNWIIIKAIVTLNELVE